MVYFLVVPQYFRSLNSLKYQYKFCFMLTLGTITPGLPTPRPPAFSSTVGNTTYTAAEMFSHLGSGLLVVPVVGIISNVAIAKAFGEFYFVLWQP